MREKKTIIILILVLTIGIVGLTIAYFANSSSVDNVFTTQPYGTTVTENFTSPSNWLPGDTTNKTVVATNSGNVDEAVRISLSESWVTANHGTLNGWITVNGNKSSHLPENEPSTDERVAVINFDNTSDWTYSNGYYYYNYKLSPNESTSSLIKSVTFNAKTKLDDTCVETPTATGKTITCNSSGNDYDDATYTLTFTVETIQYDKYQEAWGTNVAILEEKPQPVIPVVEVSGVEKLATTATNAANAEFNEDTKGKMFTFTHELNGNTVNESRYIGDAPNNYVYFNCDEPQEGVEYNYATSCEVWRILGVFNVDDGTGNVEQRMKLVRGSDFATTMAFHGPDYSSSKNDWTISNLNTFLNGDYYNRTGEAATYGLKASAKSMIGDAVYYLGAVSWDSTNDNWGSTSKIYGEERGTTVCGACNSDTTKLTWTGIVGLMYPSDEYMVYGNGVNTTCYDNQNGCNGTNAQTGWVFNSNILEGQSSPEFTWLLSSRAGTSGYVLFTDFDGALNNANSYNSYGVRPVVYLKSNIQIIDGDGTSGNPYKLQ